MGAKLRAQYHWVIAAVSIFAMLMIGGVSNSLGGVTLIPITQSLGVSRGALAWAIMPRNLAAFCINFFSGALFIKFGYRKLMSVCLLLSAIGLCITAGSNSLPLVAVGCMLEGIYSLCLLSGAPRILGPWFHKHYGLVLGVVTAMTGLGGSLFSLLLSKIITAAGWRGAYLACAGSCFLVAVLTFLVVRNRPSEMNLLPYGEGHLSQNTKKDSRDHWAGFPMEKLKKMPVFYLTVLGTLLSCVGVYMANAVVVSHVQDCGMDAEFAASMQSLMLICLMVAKLVFGYLSDKIGAKWVTLCSLLALTVSLLLLAEITGPVSASIAVVVYGAALPLSGIVPHLLTPCLFGYQSGPKAMGIIMAMLSAGALIGNPLTNTLRDSFGSYRPVFRGTALVMVGVIVLYLVVYAMADKARKAYEREQV